MGVDIHVLRFLLNFKGKINGIGLCLGRQGFHIHTGTAGWARAQELVSAVEPNRSLHSLISQDGFSEPLFEYLGARTVESMDITPAEGATYLHDLNKPVAAAMYEKFDFILDGGTLEHVFNYPIAISSVKLMLRPGGLFIGVNPANNQLGHGLYQFSPDLFWRVFSKESGFVIEKMQIVPLANTEPIDLRDIPGKRQEIGRTDHSMYIMVAARRLADQPLKLDDVYQTDYGSRMQQYYVENRTA